MQVAAGTQGTHFPQKVLRQHGIKALGDARVQPGAVLRLQRNQRGLRLGVRPDGAVLARMKVRQRQAADAKHFERALDALAVGRGQTRGGGGVHLREFGVQRGPALRFGLPRPPALAHRLDADTSGVLVLGRHPKALAKLEGSSAVVAGVRNTLSNGIATVEGYMGTTIDDWQSFRRAGDNGTLRVRIMAYAAGTDNMALVRG